MSQSQHPLPLPSLAKNPVPCIQPCFAQFCSVLLCFPLLCCLCNASCFTFGIATPTSKAQNLNPSLSFTHQWVIESVISASVPPATPPGGSRTELSSSPSNTRIPSETPSATWDLTRAGSPLMTSPSWLSGQCPAPPWVQTRRRRLQLRSMIHSNTA